VWVLMSSGVEEHLSVFETEHLPFLLDVVLDNVENIGGDVNMVEEEVVVVILESL